MIRVLMNVTDAMYDMHLHCYSLCVGINIRRKNKNVCLFNLCKLCSLVSWCCIELLAFYCGCFVIVSEVVVLQESEKSYTVFSG